MDSFGFPRGMSPFKSGTDERLISRIAMVPGSKQVLIEAPHILLPWSRTRVIAAPLEWLSLSTPMYTGRGSFLLLLVINAG
jgi:hypothetical protein